MATGQPFKTAKVTAGANVKTSRFVQLSGNFQSTMLVTSGTMPLGISTEQARNEASSSYAAASGDPFTVYQDGAICDLLISGNVAYGDLVRPGPSGKGLVLSADPGSGLQFYGARALQSGQTDEYISVQVMTGAYTKAGI